ncbi:MAG TPA: hypothetical protein VFW90_03975 [Candidatus Saccharimonadales bacterium]|nr:hypothetical protein [Candidatus Saccharimonadales bacterium]
MAIDTERFSSQLIPQDEIDKRRSAERVRQNLRRQGRMALAGVGIGLTLAGASVYLTRGHENPRKAQLRAALVRNEIPTANPGVVIEPYNVGKKTLDVMLSEVAADLHPLSTGNQDAMGAIEALETYLTDEQQESGQTAFSPGQHLDVAIDKDTGAVLPRSEALDSAPWGK